MKNYGKLEMAKPAFWLGIVESHSDVNSAGRYKVRIFGYHTADKSKLPTKDLPYAVPINPVTSASMNGIMETPNLVQGSTVFGCFLDGEIGQTPVILGSIAGEPAEQDFQDGQGFSDPAKVFPRAASGTAAQSNNEEGIIDGAIGAVTDAVSGAISSLTGGLLDGEDANDADVGTGFSGVGEPDISRLARGEAAETHYSLVNRRAKIAAINEFEGTDGQMGVPTAKAPFTDKSAEALLVACSTNGDTETKPWKLPDARATEQGETTSPKKYFDPKSGGSPTGEETSLYPFNQVTETLSGIVKEYDNTPGNIRISEFHPANTWYEIHNDGSKTTYVSGSDNVVIEGDSNVFIQGNANLTVGKNMKQKVKGDYYLEVEGNMYHTVHGERHVSIGQSKGGKDEKTGEPLIPPGNDVYANKGSEHKEINGSQSHNIGGQLYNNVAGVPPGTKKPETYGVFFNCTNGMGISTAPGDANKGITITTTEGPFNIVSNGFDLTSNRNVKLMARDNMIFNQQTAASKDGVANEFKLSSVAPATFEHSDTHTTTVDKAISLLGKETRVDTIKGQDTLKVDNLDIMKHDDSAVQIDLTGTLDASVEVKAGDPEVTLTGHVHPQTGGTGGDGDAGVDTGSGVG